MTAICYIGIELSARTQIGLLAAEILASPPSRSVALVKVYAGDPGGFDDPGSPGSTRSRSTTAPRR